MQATDLPPVGRKNGILAWNGVVGEAGIEPTTLSLEG